jgi:hypothetical protein
VLHAFRSEIFGLGGDALADLLVVQRSSLP